MIIADVIAQERDALMCEYLFPEGVLGGLTYRLTVLFRTG
jgi:hypothetical protein